MFNIIVLFLCAFYLWSSAVAAPYHEADYKLENGNNNNNNNDGEFHNRKTVIRKSESVLISTRYYTRSSPSRFANFLLIRSTEAENNPSDVNQFKDYYDNVLKPSFNMTRLIFFNVNLFHKFNNLFNL